MDKWDVLEQETLSNHLYILYGISDAKHNSLEEKHGWSWRKLDSNKLKSFVQRTNQITYDGIDTV